jgi:hypothetical protein
MERYFKTKLKNENVIAPEEQFKRYEKVRVSGKTNMFDVKIVEMLSGLSKDVIFSIMNNYSELKEKYGKDI